MTYENLVEILTKILLIAILFISVVGIVGSILTVVDLIKDKFKDLTNYVLCAVLFIFSVAILLVSIVGLIYA